MTAVHTPTKTLLLVLAALTLTQCKQQPSKTPAPTVQVTGALTAALQTGPLLDGLDDNRSLPSAPLGMYVSSFMIDSSGIHVQGAANGVNAGLGILLADQNNPTASFELLQELGIVLQVNVPDTLNRSTDRQKTLDAYIATLTSVTARSKTEVTALKQQQTQLLATQHDKRAAVTTIQHDLNLALQKQDYTTASAKQSEIVNAKAEQAKAESEVTQINSTIDLYTSLNKIADKRLAAITANRQILIAGLEVVNVPGIEELGILKNQNGFGTSNRTNIFGNP